MAGRCKWWSYHPPALTERRADGLAAGHLRADFEPGLLLSHGAQPRSLSRPMRETGREYGKELQNVKPCARNHRNLECSTRLHKCRSICHKTGACLSSMVHRSKATSAPTNHPNLMRLHMTTAAEFKAVQESSIDTFFRLAGKTFEGIEKLAELNIQTIKTLVSEAQEAALTLLSIKDPQELVTLQSGLLKPAGEKAAAYARHVRGIVAATRAEFTKAAEVSVTEVRKTLLAAVDSAAKSGPAGSEHAVALVKTAVEGARSAAEGMQLAVKQATEVTEASLDDIIDVEPKAYRVSARTQRSWTRRRLLILEPRQRKHFRYLGLPRVKERFKRCGRRTSAQFRFLEPRRRRESHYFYTRFSEDDCRCLTRARQEECMAGSHAG